MLEIEVGANDVVMLSGRFDASQVERVRPFFLSLSESRTVDLSRLDYISSAGLGVLLAAQKRLSERGQSLKLVNVSSHIRDVFRYSGFDQIFEIQ